MACVGTATSRGLRAPSAVMSAVMCPSVPPQYYERLVARRQKELEAARAEVLACRAKAAAAKAEWSEASIAWRKPENRRCKDFYEDVQYPSGSFTCPACSAQFWNKDMDMSAVAQWQSSDKHCRRSSHIPIPP